MEFIKIFIITQLIFLSFQFIHLLKLESFQYSELIFGSVFIIVFFGFFGSILTLDIIQQEQTVLNNSALIGTLYAIWYYLTKKITNTINSDNNKVIYY
jgi:uncharacterized membrane protein